MNRLELYVDREERLSIDFFMNHNDEYPMTKIKGKECYGIISSLCEKPLLEIRTIESADEMYLAYGENILHINECSDVLKKRGTGPIKTSVIKFYDQKKKNTPVPKKVTRKNKHIGKKIITSALVLSFIGAIATGEIYAKIKDKVNGAPKTEITYEINQSESQIDTIYDDVSTPKEDYFVEQKVDNNSNDIGKETEENEINISISYDDRSDTEKADITKAYYGSTIEKYSRMYGLNPKIVIAIATQERGIHSGIKDPGGATGLMQIQNAVWSGEKLTAYNYETKSYETVIVDEEKLSDVFYNIKVGCMYFQNCMNYMDNNILTAIQCYNMGYGNMMKILTKYSLETGKTKEQILEDVSDCGWLNYRYIITEGDPLYVEHVLSWIGSDINVNCVSDNGNYFQLNINNNTKKVK